MTQQAQTAIIVVTHDEKIIPTFKRIYHIRDGQTHEEAGQGVSVEWFCGAMVSVCSLNAEVTGESREFLCCCRQ